MSKKTVEKVELYYYKGIRIKDIEILAPKKVVRVTIEYQSSDKTKQYKTICSDYDTFSLEYACYLALAKHLYADDYTWDGVINFSEKLKFQKGFAKLVRIALSDYKKKCAEEEKKAKEEKELKEMIARKRAKSAEKKRKRKLAELETLKKLLTK